MDSLVGKELAERPQLNVWMEISVEWCPWGHLYWDQYCSINLHHWRPLEIDFLSLPAQDVLCLVHPKGWINT